jgi:hypothetical protein
MEGLLGNSYPISGSVNPTKMVQVFKQRVLRRVRKKEAPLS